MKKNTNLVYALLGNAIEFYDFIIYAFLATIMAKVFFPEQSPLLGLLSIYGIHFGGYLMRPLGSLLIGHIGDKEGRKEGLAVSILYTGFCTLLIGALPTYESIGVASALLLVVLRLLQGLFVSGEQGGAVVYLTEIFGSHKKGLVGGLVLSSVFSGILFGSLITYLITLYLGEAEMVSWGWRIPFLLAFPASLICWWGRKKSPESDVFIKQCLKNDVSRQLPVIDLFKHHKGSLVQMISFIGIYSVMTAIYMVFLPNHLKLIWPSATIAQETTVGLLIMTLLLPLFGYLSDKLSPHQILKLGTFLIIIFYPFAIKFITSSSYPLHLLGHAYFIVSILMIAAPIFAIITEGFPTQVKYSGTSFVFNTSIAIFSGLTPIICNSIMINFGSIMVTGYWVIGVAIVSLLAVFRASNNLNFNKHQGVQQYAAL